MKKTILFYLSFLSFTSLLLAQQSLPIVQATSTKTLIIEGDGVEILDWYLVPEAKPDVYKIQSRFKTTSVRLRTDIDSIQVLLHPGEQLDFIVVLNGKDSCYTRFVSDAPITRFMTQHPATHDTIPFVLTEKNNIIIKAILNQTDTLDMNFDSGSSRLVLKRDAILEKTKLLADQPGVKEGTAKPDYRKMSPFNSLQIGPFKWDSLPVIPTVLSADGSDGRFAWDIFDGRVLEIDYDKNIFIVHSSLGQIPEGYAKFEMEYRSGFLHIAGDLFINGKKFKSTFLVDSGYQRSILLDSILMQEQNFPKDLTVIKTNTLRNGQGKVFITKIIKSDRLTIGDFSLPDIPTQLLSTANPAGTNTHFLGNEVLKRFNTIFDFQHHCIYLKPNGLTHLPYVDAS